MLSSILKEHQAKQVTRKEEQEIRRKEALGAANDLTHALVDHLNVGVAQAYLNQKKLDAEAKQLHTNAITFSKQTQQWLSLVDNFNSALKEIGDVENWAKVIEEDMRVISAALETAYEGSMNENAATGGAPKEDN
uniref:Biogenesis of lysosome-related organelles complex 1 subunit 1 n=1 Tax=Cacopsylla melanoneura TaxID=428564 RepID=A0A8D9C0M8_9HEMI